MANSCKGSRSLILAGCLVFCGACADAESGGDKARAAQFVGTWNYDFPDWQSGRGIGKITCPATDATAGFTLAIPQIGNIELMKVDDRTIAGTTDQGCRWTFGVQGNGAELEPTSQSCFNHVINSSYTLDWTLSVEGAHATEVITGASHLPNGDCDFELEATRTKVDPAAEATAAFVGTWTFDPSDSQTRVNVLQTACPSSDGGTPQIEYAPVTGKLVIAKSGDNAISVMTDDGCTFELTVAGNTAELNASPQVCQPTDGGPGRSVSFWSMASDGRHQAAIIAGSTPEPLEDCSTLVSAGSLSQ